MCLVETCSAGLHKLFEFVSNSLNLIVSSGLDILPFCAAEYGQKPVYDLYAVVNHFGSMIGGHYTADVRLCDEFDSSKSEIGEH